MALKNIYKIWFWEMREKTPEQMLRYRRAGIWKPSKWNYIPLKGAVFDVPIKQLSSRNRIAELTFNKCGSGHFLLKSFVGCSKSRKGCKNRALCEITIEDLPDGKYRASFFKLWKLQYYFFWKKSDLAIQQILDRGTTRRK